ncbi:hypothetical protein GCM10010124_35500 [Pilimelia terevasa]|uniref:Response regulatory domain-containing protein n=1 Tax=Pilimelia terevasa TaxID=53372 RepID=A0A8J3BTG4_9ACTN|nr:SpoIIE family protein phosphatase [Pilimelia terevasa]GGK39787.1 hypothetical protein GCM10010124_35500 [Pilimelia terevasa]
MSDCDRAGGRILVVDDSPPKRYLLVNWLRRAGFAVTEAGTGGEALRIIRADVPEVVILDVRLPDMSGFAVCEAIKSDPSLAPTPVIHVSAHAVDVADRTQGLNRGADGYLVEPIDPGELVASVHSVLRYYRARRRAELLADRLGALARVTLDLTAAASVSELVTVAAEGAALIFGSPAAAVVESPDGARTAASVAGPGAPPQHPPVPPPRTTRPTGLTVATYPADVWPELGWPAGDTFTAASARLRADRSATHILVPTAAATPGSVLQQLTQTVAAAAEAQRSYDEEHRIAITLQRSLLPRSLPRPAGVDLAVRYLPADSDTEVGGDFYELAMVEDQLVAAIGDVAGHSLHAATVMGEVRHALRAYAVDGHPPGAVLDRLNRLLRLLLPAETATLCLLTYDPATGRVRLANAGHMPPLLLPADGPPRYVVQRGVLLGVDAPRPADAEFVLPPGAGLLLYTDGLVERRDAVIDEGFDRLAAVAARAEADPEAFCDRVLAEMCTTAVDDDVAVVVLRRH